VSGVPNYNGFYSPLRWTPDELREFARDKMAAYKYPRQVWLVEALPKGPTGKILRREVHPPGPPAARRDS